MPVPIEDDETTKQRKEIYNQSIKLLELINVLIPRIDGVHNPKLSANLIKEISDMCWEYGANLACYPTELQFESDDKDHCDGYAG